MDCPREWKILSINQQAEVVKFALLSGVAQSKFIREGRYFGLNPNLPILPRVSALLNDVRKTH